jgi:GTP-binding protein EngB required for normal cell division
MTIVGRLRHALRRDGQDVDADALVRRVNALDRFSRAAADFVPSDALRPARVVAERAGGRLALSRDHTVVALAGATGSGKSSLFNALIGMDLSTVGVRRPTTGIAHACVWQQGGAGDLLDWLAIPPAQRFVRESLLDADDEAALRGLVLLDLPDFDSVNASHRMEVDRLLRLVDLIVWVTDPQKYADQVIHEQYLRTFHRHAASTVVVLNQADRLSDEDVARCLTDLRGLLAANGLGSAPVFPVSATAARPGTGELRATLADAVAARVAVLRRLGADVDGAVDLLRPLVGPAVARDLIDRDVARDLTGALALSAGVPTVTAATGRAYRFRAGKSMGWPLIRWIRRTRPDPLRRLRLGSANLGGASASSLPESTAAERSTATLAVRAIADRASAGLPPPWPDAIATAARSHSADLPDALDSVIVRTDLGVDRKPIWWRLVGALQWLVTLAALAGALWLLVRLGLIALGLPALDLPKVGHLPVALLLLVGGAVAGLLIAVLVKPLVAYGARRATRRADKRLQAAITEVARAHVIAPVRHVLHQYTEARAALDSAS